MHVLIVMFIVKLSEHYLTFATKLLGRFILK